MTLDQHRMTHSTQFNAPPVNFQLSSVSQNCALLLDRCSVLSSSAVLPSIKAIARIMEAGKTSIEGLVVRPSGLSGDSVSRNPASNTSKTGNRGAVEVGVEPIAIDLAPNQRAPSSLPRSPASSNIVSRFSTALQQNTPRLSSVSSIRRGLAEYSVLLTCLLPVKPREEISITLVDGAVKSGKSWETTPAVIASAISKSMLERTVIALVDGELWDLERAFERSCKLELLDFNHPEGLRMPFV